MNILLLGGGGREHALAWKMVQSDLTEKLVALPGNDGIAQLDKTECVAGKIDDVDLVLKTAAEIKADLIVIGPEQPLASGMTDLLEEEGFTVFGPTRAAAQLETSKAFAKNFMEKYGIPTARFAEYDGYDQALAGLQGWDVSAGVAIKADALASGKGVVVTNDRITAEKTLYEFMVDPACTVKTEKIVIEQQLFGKEVSAFAICDGQHFVTLGYACDYKRVHDFDEGANTGGMGGYTPQGWPDAQTRKFIETEVFKKTLEGMKKDGTPFKGVLFAGLMIDGDEVNVIEFNTRFGDPETQILMPLIDKDLVPVLDDAARGDLPKGRDQIKSLLAEDQTAVHVVMVSGGYPTTDATPMQLDQTIEMPRDMMCPGKDNTPLVFIAGAALCDDVWVNTGGRVIGVTAKGPDLARARKAAYDTIKRIHFTGAHYRTDIAQETNG
ncbi:MAG: phosphoribosylamine--glycine ligase [Pseudomonadota bacterium]